VVDLVSVVERTRTLLQAQAREQGVELELGVLGDHTVQADAEQIVQVLLNIGLNGLQALQAREEPGGKIRFSLSAERRGDRGYQTIRVSNDGPQIPEADLERIFDPFMTTKGAGVGLGLSIASRIVEQHGGFIEVCNEEPGVVFRVLLPER
jgi:signal transduction histidine kinase